MAGETEQILTFISNSLSRNTYINIMDQYHSCGEAHRFPEFERPINSMEFQKAQIIAGQAGLTQIDQRDITTILRRLNLYH